jgi:hypothetical protein
MQSPFHIIHTAMARATVFRNCTHSYAHDNARDGTTILDSDDLLPPPTADHQSTAPHTLPRTSCTQDRLTTW